MGFRRCVEPAGDSESTKAMAPVRVVIVSDKPLLRIGLELVLSRWTNVVVRDLARQLGEASHLVAFQPELVLLDLDYSKGLACLEQVRRCCPSLKVVALSD